jgi:hypothetical protein
VVAVLGATPLGNAARNAVLPRNSVGPIQLKNNSVNSLKVKDRTLKAIDFALNQLPKGPKGDQGDKGDKGNKGDKGDKGDTGAAGVAGAPGISGLQIVSNSSDSNANDNKSASAPCPAGKKLIGGGATTGGFFGEFLIGNSYPEEGNNRWVASATEKAPYASDWKITTYAVCAVVAA